MDLGKDENFNSTLCLEITQKEEMLTELRRLGWNSSPLWSLERTTRELHRARQALHMLASERSSMPTNSSPTKLQFGDERFFYGNLSTYIGATIFKTLFDIRISSSEYTLTTNPTRSQQTTTNPALIKATEVAIYDNNQNLVVIGKLSEPVPLESGNTIMLELSMDF